MLNQQIMFNQQILYTKFALLILLLYTDLNRFSKICILSFGSGLDFMAINIGNH